MQFLVLVPLALAAAGVPLVVAARQGAPDKKRTYSIRRYDHETKVGNGNSEVKYVNRILNSRRRESSGQSPSLLIRKAKGTSKSKSERTNLLVRKLELRVDSLTMVAEDLKGRMAKSEVRGDMLDEKEQRDVAALNRKSRKISQLILNSMLANQKRDHDIEENQVEAAGLSLRMFEVNKTSCDHDTIEDAKILGLQLETRIINETCDLNEKRLGDIEAENLKQDSDIASLQAVIIQQGVNITNLSNGISSLLAANDWLRRENKLLKRFHPDFVGYGPCAVNETLLASIYCEAGNKTEECAFNDAMSCGLACLDHSFTHAGNLDRPHQLVGFFYRGENALNKPIRCYCSFGSEDGMILNEAPFLSNGSIIDGAMGEGFPNTVLGDGLEWPNTTCFSYGSGFYLF
eukprot:CAMPEP_0113526800 /NCGR_PEP_ID=MMETSP0015_2-20120614/945_1 /TAXON_ID=2838 /ORGANISM="Odontella" /LENGTH=402 /DNA_ID=CAMNT_0000425171 /DNA_START=245 /DNA_END=1453 /DNA_ORIENTATION=+ /assembly_acc=CAM_ASM_000160